MICEPEIVPAEKLGIFWPGCNVIVFPDIDHVPEVPLEMSAEGVGLPGDPGGGVQIPFARTVTLNGSVLFPLSNVSVPDLASAVQTAHGCGAPRLH